MSKWDQSEKISALIGAVVCGAYLANDKETLYLTTSRGTVSMETEGDCCSITWIESVENVDALIGHSIVSVEDDKYSYIQAYAMRITTDAGIVSIIYRNESNGYYGGSAWWSLNAHIPRDTREIAEDI